MESSYCQQAVTFFFFFVFNLQLPGPLTLWPAPPPLLSFELDFSLCNIASAQQIPFGIPHYIRCMFRGLTCVLLCACFAMINWKHNRAGITLFIYTTFTPHFKGKRRCISGIIALLAVPRNAVTRIGGSIYKLYPS